MLCLEKYNQFAQFYGRSFDNVTTLFLCFSIFWDHAVFTEHRVVFRLSLLYMYVTLRHDDRQSAVVLQISTHLSSAWHSPITFPHFYAIVLQPHSCLE